MQSLEVFLRELSNLKKMVKVLVVATSRKTRGGITSVVKAHETGEHWAKYHCRWIQTHIDTNAFAKTFYFVRAIFQYVFLLPFYDLVHIHLAAVNRKIPFVFLAKLFGKKLIVHLHFPAPETTLYDKRLSPRYHWCMKKADVVIVLSYQWKKLIEEIYNDIHNIKVIYNPCPSVNRDIGDKQDKYILFAGTVYHRKGFDDMIKAFAKVHQQCPGWRLVFAGNGEIERGKQLAKDNGIEDKCEFLGWVTGKKKEMAFQQASAYCLSSYAEGFPMGVLDAWAYGLPVITTPVGGLPDILQDGVNALVNEPGDIDGLACNFVKITNDKLRCKISEESVKLAEGIFSMQVISNQIDSLYDELLNKTI